MNKKEAAEAIKNLHKEWRKTYDTIAENSWNEHVKTLPVSAAIPKKGIIYGKKNQDDFMSKTMEYKQKARAVAADIMKEANKRKTDAPSEEALRALQAFKLRKPQGDFDKNYQKETQTLIDRYGDNYMVNQALHDMAREAKVKVTSHPIAAEVERLEELEHVLTTGFDSFDAVYHGAPTAGHAWVFDSQIDSIFR